MCPFLAGTINVQCKTLPAMVIIETCHYRAIIRLKHPGMKDMKDNCPESCLSPQQTLHE